MLYIMFVTLHKLSFQFCSVAKSGGRWKRECTLSGIVSCHQYCTKSDLGSNRHIMSAIAKVGPELQIVFALQ